MTFSASTRWLRVRCSITRLPIQGDVAGQFGQSLGQHLGREIRCKSILGRRIGVVKARQIDVSAAVVPAGLHALL